jgi:hypothetical protein
MYFTIKIFTYEKQAHRVALLVAISEQVRETNKFLYMNDEDRENALSRNDPFTAIFETTRMSGERVRIMDFVKTVINKQ